jgi:hypothetical protein
MDTFGFSSNNNCPCDSTDLDVKNHGSIDADQKIISITGTANKYQIKKLIAPKVSKKRTISNKWDLSEYELSHKGQFEIIQNMCKGKNFNYSYSIFIRNQIENKISSYKQQDVIKKRLDAEKFITFDQVIGLLNESELLCDYCSCEIFILYEIVRELRQWTLDRIDNDKGHNTGNVVISCLDCNVRRRRKNKDDFMFTKNLAIVRQGFIYEPKDQENS